MSRLLCRVFGHRWVTAGLDARACRRCHIFEWIRRTHDPNRRVCPVEHGHNTCTCGRAA